MNNGVSLLNESSRIYQIFLEGSKSVNLALDLTPFEETVKKNLLPSVSKQQGGGICGLTN